MTGRSVGLTLGKFAPLHLGHQYVIEAALSETDHVIVMIYDCPDVTSVDLSTRAQWISDLYPQVEVIEARGGPSEVGDDPAITRAHDQYILATLAGQRVTHFYSSEFYGTHVSAALGAVDHRVDPHRQRFNISASHIRQDPHRWRELISPRVYRDLIYNVVFLGAPSTGKTTLCEQLAKRCGTVWMPEYGREYWERNQQDRRLRPEQLVELAETHLQREDELLLQANKYMFTDTNVISTLLFARHYHGSAPQRLHELADLAQSRYSCVFLCVDDIPYDDTWDRSGDVNRRMMQDWTRRELKDRGASFTELTGPLEQRIAAVMGRLAQLPPRP